MPDHIHKMISIPPKRAVSLVVGFINGEIGILIARVYAGRKRNCVYLFGEAMFYIDSVDFPQYGRNSADSF